MVQVTRANDRPSGGGIASLNTILCVTLALVFSCWVWIQIKFDTAIAQMFKGTVGKDHLRAIQKPIEHKPIETKTVAAAAPAEVAESPATPPPPPSLKDQFCPFCEWKAGIFCQDRLDYMMNQHGMLREAALEHLIMDSETGCKKNY